GALSPLRTGSCTSGGNKPRVLLDGGNLFGKLHFSLWRPCHKSFRRKPFTTSISRSGKRLSSTAYSSAAIPRRSSAGTSKCLHWCSRNGIRKRSVSRNFAIFSRAWWNTEGTSWRSLTLWSVRTFTTTGCSKGLVESRRRLGLLQFSYSVLRRQVSG